MARTITTTLPDELARFAEAEVAAGRFPRVEDVLEAGVDALRRRRERHEAKVKALGAALEEGERSGFADDAVFDRIRAKHGLPPAPGERRSLAELFARSPLKGLDLTFARERDEGRPVKL